MAILDGINTSSDIKKLNIDELKTLCDELRETIISTAKTNGGHFASNLGAVETTVALHYVFDFPKDKLIFDVGHQCYVHKILSNRKKEFGSIRLDGGISGFPNRDESEYDAFTTGHAGTSISAGLGFCEARDILGENYSVIELVGDGSFVNGLNLEAITSSNVKPKNMLVILNDNGMSISKNKNGLYKLISKGTTKERYINGKKAFKKVFGESFITRFLRKIKNFVKILLNRNAFFERFGFKYIGVIDGNNISELVKILKRVKNSMKEKSVFLHIKTTKGKGDATAEDLPSMYHGVGKDFKIKSSAFSTMLGNELLDIIEKDKRVVAITAGMKDGTGIACVEEKFPKNFIDVGIAEEYAVTLSAGMAAGGVKPVVAIYSTFLQRAYDQILHDVCIPNLPVVFCIDRAGLVGADGETHQGVFDLSYLSHLPNMTILAPANTRELKDAIRYAISISSPVAIRYPSIEDDLDFGYQSGKATEFDLIKGGKDLSILAVGPRMLKLAFDIQKDCDKDIGIINAKCVKPLDKKLLLDICDRPIITLEENSLIGGFGSLVKDFYAKNNIDVKVSSFGVKDEFVKHGSIDIQLKGNGLVKEEIIKNIM